MLIKDTIHIEPIERERSGCVHLVASRAITQDGG